MRTFRILRDKMAGRVEFVYDAPVKFPPGPEGPVNSCQGQYCRITTII